MENKSEKFMYFLIGLTLSLLIFMIFFGAYQISKSEMENMLDSKLTIRKKISEDKNVIIPLNDFLIEIYNNQIKILNK
ncbi:MAG: hypothetical protein Q8L27_02995 [archaeon]|nr:hypothetical protein [archaeon]